MVRISDALAWTAGSTSCCDMGVISAVEMEDVFVSVDVGSAGCDVFSVAIVEGNGDVLAKQE